MPLLQHGRNHGEVISDDGATDEDEDTKKDFFESMIYW